MTLIYNDDSLNNIIRGTNLADYITSLNGNDRILGYDGDDTIYSGNGNDTVYGGNGNDIIYDSGSFDLSVGGSEQGDDYFNGGDGNDSFILVGGKNTLVGGAGDDFAYLGNASHSKVYGSDGNDSITWGEGNDTVYGDAGDDYILASGGNDKVFGGIGNDTIVDFQSLEEGIPNSDVIHAGEGKDTFVIGWFGYDYTNMMITGAPADGSSDYYYGDAGVDTFEFRTTQNLGIDRIMDFNANHEKLVFYGLDSMDDLNMRDTHLGVKISFDDGGMILLYDTTMAELSENNFEFLDYPVLT